MSNQLAILSGSFNPLHDGHLQMRQAAELRLKCPVHFEISVVNVDKPSLHPSEIEKRLAQFGDATCWITRASTFEEKAAIFPNTVFVVGADTIARVADVRYYDNSDRRMRESISVFSSQGCRFLVFGRKIDKEFVELPSLEVRKELEQICDWVSESEFRIDINSTAIREGR